MLTRTLRPTDFNRISFYASRIKSLGPCPSRYCLNQITLALIFQRYQSKSRILLLALRDLSVSLHDFLGLALYPRLIIGPNVRSVIVNFKTLDEGGDHPIPWDNIAAILKPYASGLTRFGIVPVDGVYRPCRYSPEPIMDLYHAFQCLTVLDTNPFNLKHDALQHLATLPRLQTLFCMVPPKELAQANLTGKADCFPSLARLEVDTADLVSFLVFFQHITSRNLRTVVIGEDSVVGAWDLKPLFETLASSKSCTNLDKLLILRQDKVNWASSPSSCPEISSVTLASLFPLSRLATLDITIDV